MLGERACREGAGGAGAWGVGHVCKAVHTVLSGRGADGSGWRGASAPEESRPSRAFSSPVSGGWLPTLSPGILGPSSR